MSDQQLSRQEEALERVHTAKSHWHLIRAVLDYCRVVNCPSLTAAEGLAKLANEFGLHWPGTSGRNP